MLGVLGSALATCMLVATGTALGPGADATPGPGPVIGGGDVDAHPGTVRALITFTKAPAHPWNSRLAWDAWKQRADGTWKLVAHDDWRAGSGFPGRSATKACVKGRGWLPNGTYSLRQYADYPGTLIHGRAFRLSDKRCRNGTLRQELFIHTESAAGNRQCPDGPGDQICRWEFPKINDYTSHGCIKMAPADLLALTREYHRFFRPGIRYSTAKVSLLVR